MILGQLKLIVYLYRNRKYIGILKSSIYVYLLESILIISYVEISI